ncbi:UvrD-helicase domain-containing protein [Peptoniphilaceae bacterium SGI.137]
MSMKFTEEQEKALTPGSENRIISAQAGAGKTGVLVERIIRKLLGDGTEEGIGLENQLIVTFTRKAAAEMKTKIRAALYHRLEDDAQELSREQRRWILTQLNALSGAHIQTLHAFCYDILHEYADRIDWDPAFRILDGKILSRLMDEALEETLMPIYQQGSGEQLQLIEAYGSQKRRSDQGIRALILKLSSLANQHENPVAWIQEWKEKMISEEFLHQTLDMFQNEILGQKLENLEDLLQEVRRNLDSLEKMAADSTFPGAFYDFMRSECREVESKMAEWKQGNTDPSIVFQRQPAVRKPSMEIKMIVDPIKDNRKLIKKECSELSELALLLNPVQVARENVQMARNFSILGDMVIQFEAIFQEKKNQQNGADFNDVEHKMLELLRDEGIANELRRRYRAIFFDEYQDANDLQDQIIERLSSGKNLFFVGDVKQSIYGFRQAEPENFLKRYDRYSDSQKDQAIDLTVNFRSDKEILDFVNLLFCDLMTSGRGGVHYDTETHRSRHQSALSGTADKNASHGHVTITILEEDASGREKASSFDEISSEAFYIAHTIQDLVKKGARYGDVAILFRTGNRIFQFERVLDAFSIPYYSDSKSVNLESTEVQLAFHLLHIIRNEQSDVELLSVLSSVGKYTDEELAQMRIRHPEGSFADAYHADVAEGEKKATELERCLKRWRELLKEKTLVRWLWMVLDESGIYSFAEGLAGGKERRENLHTLLRLAEEYENSEQSGLFGFLEYAKRVQAGAGEDMSPGSELSEHDNVVRLMTIHKSKGLQFPIVFLAETGKRFNEQDLRETLVYDKQTGPAMTLLEWNEEAHHILSQIPLRKKIVMHRIGIQQKSEEVRIFYVALTRAISQLFLVGHVRNLDDVILGSEKTGITKDRLDSRLSKDSSYLQWVVHILQAKGIFPTQSQDVSPDLSICLDYGSVYREIQNAPQQEQEMPALTLLTPVFEWDYQYLSDTTRPMKETVTDLAKRSSSPEETEKEMYPASEIFDAFLQTRLPENGAVELQAKPCVSSRNCEQEGRKIVWEHFYPMPRFMQGKKEFTAAERGTLMHRALQALSLDLETREEIESALDELINREYFTKEEADVISVVQLERFFHSDLLKALRKKAKKIIREQSFTLRLQSDRSTRTVDGQIDLFAETDAGLVLVDFKTDRHPDASRYLDQMRWYKRALETSFRRPVIAAYLYWVSTGESEKIQI